MNTLLAFPGMDRAPTLLMFALYMITSVQIVRYSKWIAAGQPNPFLPGYRPVPPARTRPVSRRVADVDLSQFRVY